MTETTLASVTRKFKAKDYGPNAVLTVTAKAYQLNGNKHPYFSVTGEIRIPKRSDCEACGCLHEEALQAWPAIKPIVDLHLANADDGRPMHAEANGWYWMAGALGGCGEQYHGGNSSTPKTEDECLAIFADHARVTVELATVLRDSLKSSTAPRAFFGAWIVEQSERWKVEAQAGLALLLSAAQEAA